MGNFEKTEKIDRLSAEARDICPICEQAVWLSFYFDAFGHNKDEDGLRISNIGKLWTASLTKPEKGIRRYYYPGLGATFQPELAALAAMELKKIAEDIKKAEEDIGKKAAKDTVKTIGKEIWEHKEGWWQRVETTLKKDTKNLYHQYKDQYRIVFNKKDRDKYLRGIGRYWKNFAEDLIHHPGRVFKAVQTELANTAAQHSIERWGFVRDAAWVAALFNTGVDTRLEVAMGDFKEAVNASKKIGNVKHINVAVFGADMGGALAIAFVNKLLKDVCEKGKYQGAAVHFRFMGLFDCVASRFDDNFITGFVPLANSVTGDLKLHKSVEKVVHFAAAHENRLYKQLSSIGGVKQPGSRLEERLFPGAQLDVTGGYEPGEQGIDNQLSRLPLRMMLGRAWRSGVPVYSLNHLENGNSIQLTSIYSSHYKMDSAVNDLVYDYWAKVKELSTTVKTVSTVDYKDIVRGYADTGTVCAPLPDPVQLKTVPLDIKGELPGHMALYVSWLKHWYNTHEAPDSFFLRSRHGFLKNEIKRLSRAAQLSPLDPAALRSEEQVIWTVWNNNDSKLLGNLTPLFERYVHDSMAGNGLEQFWDDFVFSRHYLAYRTIITIEQMPDKDFFKTLFDKIYVGTKDAAKGVAKDQIHFPKGA